MPPTERRALALLLSLAVVGQGVRWLATRPDDAPGEVEILAALPPKSPLAHRDSLVALARPLAPGERIDADRATAAELARLPRVGPALARAIVAYREENGPFGGAEALDRVPGLGPSLMASIMPHVAFGHGGQAIGRTEGRQPQPHGISSDTPPGRSSGSSPPRLDLNSASATDLDVLPGIGPTRAASIVQYRAQHGPFRSLEDLGRVPGIGPAALARLRDHVALP